jgi:hypothetical protein
MESNALRLFTFLVGQPQLLAQKSAFHAQDKEQIVARFMVEELAFRGIDSAAECAAVLSAYDHGEYPEHSRGVTCASMCPKHMQPACVLGNPLADNGTLEYAHINANPDGRSRFR